MEKYSQDDVLKLAEDNLHDLVKLCQKTCHCLGVKGSKRCNIYDLLDYMKKVPEFINDKQESSAHGFARTTLALCL
jgi:hypothetical protein